MEESIMIKKPLLSVIVPIYNTELYLRQCLESLASQTLEDIEVLLIDDGSTDGSAKIADAFAAANKQMKAYHRVNGGISDARNFGLDLTTGDYIGFVDSDDWVEYDMFEKMLDRAVSKGADIVVCAAYRHDDDKGLVDILRIREDPEKFGSTIAERPSILYAAYSYPWNKIFRSRLFLKHRFPLGQWFEDPAVIYNVMAEANRIDCVDEPLYHYRFMRPGAITKSVSPKMFDIFKSCDSIINYYKSRDLFHGIYSEVLEKVIRGHIMARLDLLLKSGNRKFARRYIDQAFAYMNKHFPGWKKRYRLGKDGSGTIHRLIRTNRWLARLFLYIPFKAVKILKYCRLKYQVILSLANKKDSDSKPES